MANVLLVDDNGSVLLTLAIALRRHGHTVTIASDGSSALEEIRAGQFDALVSDVRMPGLSGPELASAARELQPHLRIVLTSAYPSVETSADIQAFLRKPIDVEQLHSLLAQTGGSTGAPPAATQAPSAPRRKNAFVERRRLPRQPLTSMQPARA